MGAYKDLDALARAVRAADGQTILCSGADLRDVGQESRLKALARERIQDRLRSEGLVAIPDVPQYQHEPVYVTKIGSPLEQLANALTGPTDSGLRLLRGAAGGSQDVANMQAAMTDALAAIAEADATLRAAI